VSSNHLLSGFERLAALPKLEILDLGSNSFGYSVIPSLSRLASLKTLSLAGNYLGFLNTTTGNLLSLAFFPLYL
jgi:Leucine-rich repeat (LRR) protein